MRGRGERMQRQTEGKEEGSGRGTRARGVGAESAGRGGSRGGRRAGGERRWEGRWRVEKVGRGAERRGNSRERDEARPHRLHGPTVHSDPQLTRPHCPLSPTVQLALAYPNKAAEQNKLKQKVAPEQNESELKEAPEPTAEAERK